MGKRQKEGGEKHDLFLDDLQRISDYLHSTNCTALEDIHLHVVEPTEKPNQNSILQTRGDNFFLSDSIIGREKTKCGSGVGIIY